MKKIFVIDWWLVVTFLMTLLSGFGLYIAGYGTSHTVWHNWAVFHVIASLLFLISAVLHVKTHWGWYKGLFGKGIGKKSRITIMLSTVFVAASVTGMMLLCVDGENSLIGNWHFWFGVALTLFSVWHIILRINVLLKNSFGR